LIYQNRIKFIIAAICTTRKFRMVVAMVIMPHLTLNSYH